MRRGCWQMPSTGCPSCSEKAWRGRPSSPQRGAIPTAAGLALAPLVRRGLVEPTGIIVDAASGVSGAGRGLKESLHFGTVDEDFTAYGLLTHRHTPEMEQILGVEVLFTPHLAPMTRWHPRHLLRPTGRRRGAEHRRLMAVLHDAYDAEPFVVVTDDPPSTKATAGGERGARVGPGLYYRAGCSPCVRPGQPREGRCSGQAIQCANAALGLPEITGLPIAGVYP